MIERGGKPMRTWALITQKGGSGKTTLALHLAVAAVQHGLKVAVVDCDPQRSAIRWAAIRDLEPPRIVGAITPELPRLLDRLEAERFDLVLIDTSPRADRDLIVVAGRADLIVLPVRPSILDIPAVADTLKLIKVSGQSDRAVMVLNAVPPRTEEAKEAAGVLIGVGELLGQQIGERADFRRALTAGQGIAEFDPKGKAAQEVEALYKALTRKMKLES
jgi:chromosome partitioning protein